MTGGPGAGWSTSALVLALLVAVPAATAADGSFDLDHELPVTATGAHATTGTDAAALLQGQDGQVVFLLEGHQGTLERVIHRATGYVSPEDPKAGVLWRQTVETVEEPLADTYITLQERLPGFTLLAYDGPLSLQTGARNGPLHIGALEEDLRVQSTAEPPLHLTLGPKEAQPFQHVLPAGDYQARTLDGRLTADGGFRLYLADALVEVHTPEGTQTLQAYFREETRAGGIYDPVEERWMGPGTHTEYVHEYLVLHLADARLQVQHVDTPAFLTAPRVHTELAGEALFPAATGTVTVTDEHGTTTHAMDGEDLRLGGRFTVSLEGLEGLRTSATHGSGDITTVTYATETHEYDWATIAAATGLGALLLAFAAWVTGGGKSLLASLGGAFGVAGYARVQGEEILEHPGRLEVYERVKADPGMHFQDIAQRVDFGASTLNYHLRVLERNEYVTRVKDGRYVRFFDAKSGAYSRDRKQAASTLRNATTAAIASYIVQHPGVVQRDLAKEFRIAPSTVSWHVDRLRKEGLVDKQRDQHFTRYYMGDAWSTLPARELARVGLVA